MDDDVSSPDVGDGGIEALYAEHGRALLRFLLRLTHGDRHRAEDILQETLLRAWKHREARGPDGTGSRPWLFTVARRIVVDQVRAAAVRPIELGDDRLDERPADDDLFDRVLDRVEVRAALLTLPERLRSALVEVYLRGHSVAEAAQTLGVPPGTVKSRTFYALRALREALARKGFQRPPSNS